MLFYNKLAPFFVVLLAFVGSYFLLGHYQGGDQYFYRMYYEKAEHVGLVEAIGIGSAMLNAGEPVSLAVLWAGSKLGLEKDIYVSILNCLLVGGLYFFCKKNKTPMLAFVLLVMGYYVLVLMTGAERLKIGYIFMIWSFVFFHRLRLIFYALSFLSHFQMLLFLFVFFIKVFLAECSLVFRSGKASTFFLSKLVVFFVVLFPLLIPVLSKIYSKVHGYFGGELKLLDVVNVFLLFLVGFFVYRRWVFQVWGLLLFLPFVIVLGGSRVNLMAVTFAFFFFIQDRKMMNPLVLSLLLYFVYKSIFFMSSVILYGDGFV